MFGLSLGHIIVVLVVLLLFGARRLPELGSSLGKGLRAFKKGIESDDDQSDKLAAPQSAQSQKSDSSSGGGSKPV